MDFFLLTRADSGIISEPFAFVRTGDYYWIPGRLASQGKLGLYWTSLVATKTYSRALEFSEENDSIQYGTFRGYGFSIRCVDG